ncbi:MAG: hypothetical protein U5N58_11450 [Actinomycetota bacterium]|nr:hypothetical protein [Actinomycetota bacterium]
MKTIYLSLHYLSCRLPVRGKQPLRRYKIPVLVKEAKKIKARALGGGEIIWPGIFWVLVLI